MKLSVIDQSPVPAGFTPADALHNTIELARLTDRLWDLPGLRPAWPARERPEWAPSMPNFVLVSLVDTRWTSSLVHDALARRGIFVRECSNYRRLEVGALYPGASALREVSRLIAARVVAHLRGESGPVPPVRVEGGDLARHHALHDELEELPRLLKDLL